MHTAPSSVPTQDRQEEPQGLSGVRQSMSRDHLRRRRRCKVQIRGLTSHRTTERGQEPMERNLPNTETQDQDMLDQSSPRDENISLPESNIETAPIDSAMASPYGSHYSTGPRDADTTSNCTRISFEANTPEQDPGGGSLTVAPDPQDAHDDQVRVNNALPPASPESEADHSSNISGHPGQPGLDAYLAHLRRAQEEQERLEQELERERLNEELGLSNQGQLPPGDSPQFEDRQNSLAPASDNEPAAPVHADIEHPSSAPNVTSHDLSPVSRREGQPELTVKNPDQIRPISRDVVRTLSTHASSTDESRAGEADSSQPQQGPVEIQFLALEREQWRQSDRLLVDPSDPSPLERLARKYLRKGYSLYDAYLQHLRPAQCFRAATVDGENSIFMISEHEERELVAAGRLTQERLLLTMASQALDRIEEETPGRSVTQRIS
ncbi:uncharacterized protein N7473_004456 [Penicillium subrubescens]|uniref:Uncharacterized protein n=1 Tax=Penicillium subrubescens TaxID=1316194 RepID=A0A1Q5UD48_9EURO|nr:uncharacterized protein N7473_004456 [Penicillium subrubescens]KAJ5900386.1 hypothetical protein N7473_004456 [Penicillium subrubescens]OKP10392.1 hypothetical protein PENSUB_4181 [Penicillium subrubescens]